MTTRTMSEKKRAFLALSGQVYPRVGDRAFYVEGYLPIDAEFSDDVERIVEVVRVSATGATIWTRFVHPEGQIRFGMGLQIHRWARSSHGHYGNGGLSAPVGDLVFR